MFMRKGKVRQAFVIVLAVLMLMTMMNTALPSWQAYAAESTIETDKDVYEIGDPIYVTASTDISGAWVSLLNESDPSDAVSYYWYYVDGSDSGKSWENGKTYDMVYDTVCSKRDGYTSSWNFPAGDYKVVMLKGNYEPVVSKSITITAGTTPEGVTAEKTTFSASDPILVSMVSHDTDHQPWVGLYTGTKTIEDTFDGNYIDYYYCAWQNGTVDLTGKFKDLSNGEGGEYTVALFNGGYIPVGVVNFTYEGSVLTVNKEGVTPPDYLPEYKTGEPLLVTAQSGNAGAWVGIFDYDPDFPDGYYAKFDVKDVNGSVDLAKLASDAGKPLNPGKYRIYLSLNINGNPDDWVKQVKVVILETYGDPTWTWGLDNTTATATFTAKHDPTLTKPVTVTGDNITSVVTKEATEEEEGERTYTATITADMIDFVTENEPPFTDVKKEVIPKLTHVHTIVPVAAMEATCEEPGNIAYYKCSSCGAFFEDEAGTIEIEDKTSVIVPAKGHAWGAWVYDAENKQHTKTCANDPTHVVREDCTFDEGVPGTDIITYTCTVCGGSYTQSTIPVITTDKTAYKFGEDIKVTTELNGYDGTTNGAWVSLQYKGEAYSNKALLWYYPALFENPKTLQSILTPVNTDWENVNGGRGTDKWTAIPAGEYELVYLEGNYERVGQPTYFTVYYEFNGPTDDDWIWADDYSSATATFKADGMPSETVTLTDSNPTSRTTKEATCLDTGTVLHSASVTVDEDAFALKGDPESRTFTTSVEETTVALGHSFGTWTTVTPATETKEGLERRVCSRCDAFEERAIPVLSHTHGLTAHPATEATCVTEGNTAYWVCDQGENPCGKYYEDAEGTKEIERDSWIIPKTDDHDYGAWVFDGADAKTHTKTCSRDASHKVTENCSFIDSEPVNGKITHTCSVCGGSYTTDVVLSTDKDTYKISEPIIVTVNYEANGAWVGLYGKDETPNPNQNPASIYWYYIDGNSTYDLTKGTKNREYGPGEYKVILFGDSGFSNIVDTKNITITDVEPSSIEVDKTEYTMGEPIMVTAKSDYPNAWVGLYDYDYSDPLDTTLLSYFMLSDSDGEPVDIWNGDIVKDKEKLEGLQSGKYKVILFSSGYDIDTDSEGHLTIRSFDLKDNTGCEHKWSDWTPDKDVMTHTRSCSVCGAVETKPCTFTHEPSSDPGIEIYTCTVCGRKYEQMTVPVITTDKEEYSIGEDIVVTTELNGENGTVTGGWVALYVKGSQTSVYGTSLLWYFPDPSYWGGKDKVLQSVFAHPDTNRENMGDWPQDWGDVLPVGNYELVFLKGDKPYTLVGQPCYFSVVRKVVSEKVTKDPTCTEPGTKHVVYDDGTEEDIEIPALGHDFDEAWVYDGAEAKTHHHVCKRCGESSKAEDCVFDEGKVTKEPTEKETGTMLYTCTICGGTYEEEIPTLASSGVRRAYGNNRYQTAMVQADLLKEELGLEKFDTIVVATGTNYADALSGAYLGYVNKAPILLVNDGTVESVKDYIKKNVNEGGTVYLLGGTAVVPESVEAGMDGFKFERLAGSNRYKTNIEILKAAGVEKEDILVCDGNNFADSLSASAVMRPILLVKGALNDDQRAYLESLPGNNYYMIGGTGAVPAEVENEIMLKYGSTSRIGGKNRYETSVAVAEAFFDKPEKAVVAYAMNYPDGLCGGTLAAYMNAPLLLVRDDMLTAAQGYTAENKINSGIVLGGPALIADASARTLFGLAEDAEIYVVKYE